MLSLTGAPRSEQGNLLRMRSNINVIAFGLAIAAFAAFQQFKLPVALPVLLQNYGYDPFLAGSFMSIYALIGLLFSIKLGALLNRRNMLKAVHLGLALFVAGAAITLAVPDNGWLVLAGRGLEGLGFAVMAIAGPVLANSNATPRQLPIVVGMTAAWIPVGQLMATALAGLGWEQLWWLSILGSLAFGAWALSLQQRDKGPANPSGASSAAAGTPPVITRLQRRTLVITGTIFMLWACQYFAYMTWLPLYLVEAQGLGVSQALLGYVVPVSLVAVFSVATGFLLRAGLSLGWLALGGLSAQALVWVTMPYMQSPALGILSLVVYGSAGGIIPACLFAAPSRAMDSGRDTAKAFGIVMTGRNMGVLVGPVLIAQAYKVTGNWNDASPIFGAITALCLPLALALAIMLPGRRPARGL